MVLVYSVGPELAKPLLYAVSVKVEDAHVQAVAP